MRRRTTRVLAPLAVIGALAALASCGSDQAKDPAAASSSAPSSTSEPSGALDNITVTGDVGQEPKVVWKDVISVDATESSVLVTGDGDTVSQGDNVTTQIWVGNGASKATAYSSFGQKPQVVSVSASTLPAISDAMDGQTLGSRVIVLAPPKDAFGDQGNPSMGIGNTDSVVFIIDLLDKLPSGPEGGDRKPAAWAPEIVLTDDLPSSLTFDGTPEPTGKLLRTTLIAGEGDPVQKGQHIYVNYLGQVYGADAPFDESYSRGTPFDFDVGAGNVVSGWDEGLVGVKVGSRVLLQVPPDKGYGKDGNPQAGIKGTDTMYFVVDVLAAL